MFHKLKRRLVLLYGITSSVILTVIITGTFIINYKQNKEQIQTLFQKNTEQIVEKIRSANVISSSWITTMQTDNHVVIFIEDNGKLLTDYSRLNTTKDSKIIIDKIKKMATEEGINLNRKPLYSTIVKTSVYNLYKNKHKAYLGMAALIPTKTGWRNIMIIYYDDSENDLFFNQIILFILIDLIGVVALFLISSLYITKVLTPLEDGQKRQIDFIAAASHELRSPLTVIKTGIASLKEDISKADLFLPHIEGECARINRLIGDMLLLASADAKTWSLFKAPIDMDTLLIESYDMFCTCYNINNYNLTLDLPEEQLHNINGDCERIKQILTILIDNAISHASFGKIITIHAYNIKDSVVIEVEDHGKGIPDEEKKQVFHRFYRGDQSRNEKKHFGLGLSIAKELTELHKGSISIKDTTGGGATFVLRLPC